MEIAWPAITSFQLASHAPGPLWPQPAPTAPTGAKGLKRSGIEGLVARHGRLHLCMHRRSDLMRRVVYRPIENAPACVGGVVARGHVVMQHSLHPPWVVRQAEPSLN
jgi:hypothetical protein